MFRPRIKSDACDIREFTSCIRVEVPHMPLCIKLNYAGISGTSVFILLTTYNTSDVS
jgi:hypothetical protein